MFLSTQWKVPSSKIEELSIVEFMKQFKFWKANKWGCEQDLLSLVVSLLVSDRSGNAPTEHSFIWKDLAVDRSNYSPKKITKSSNQQTIDTARRLAETISTRLGKK